MVLGRRNRPSSASTAARAAVAGASASGALTDAEFATLEAQVISG